MKAIVIRTAQDVVMEEVPDHLDALVVMAPSPPRFEKPGDFLPSVMEGQYALGRHTLRPDNPALPTVVAFWPSSWRDQWAIDTITEHAPRLGLVP